MSRRVSPSTDQVYGLQRVTRIWGVSRALLPPPPPAGGDRAQTTRAARCHGGRRAGASDRAAPDGLPLSWRGALRHDHGSQYVSHHFPERDPASLALDDPGLVVGLPEPLECQAQLFDGVEAADPQEVLLQHPDEALGAAVALGLADEGRRLSRPKASLLQAHRPRQVSGTPASSPRFKGCGAGPRRHLCATGRGQVDEDVPELGPG